MLYSRCFIFQALRTISRSIVGRRLIANRFFFFVMPPFSFVLSESGRIRTDRLLHRHLQRDAVCVCGLRERMRKLFAVIRKNARSPASVICLPGAVSFSNVLSTMVLHYKPQAIPQLLVKAPRHPSPGTAPAGLQPL